MAGKRPGKKQPTRKPIDPEAVAAKKERRARAAALREEQKRKAQRQRMLKQVAIVAAVGIVAVLVVLGVMKGRAPDQVPPPEGFSEAGAIAVGAEDPRATVTVIEDFACPHCAVAAASTKELLASYAESEDVRVEFKPIAFLDEYSTSEYASRALNAAVCVVGDDPANWTAVHDLLMANQPRQGGGGLSNSRLIELAVQAGADESVVSGCIEDRKHDGWVDWTTHRATSKASFAGTPTILVNGKKVDASPTAIDTAVQKALTK